MKSNPTVSPDFPFDPRRILRQARTLSRGDVHGAEDLAQECMVRALRAPQQALQSPTQWSDKVLTNLARSRWSKAHRHFEVGDDAEVPDPRAQSPDLLLERAQCVSRLRERLHNLPAMYRRVLELTYLEGMGLTEAAGLLGISYRTLCTRRQRGLLRLREQLDGLDPVV